MRSVLTMRLQHLIAGSGLEELVSNVPQVANVRTRVMRPMPLTSGDRGGGIVRRCLRRDDGHPRREIDGRRVDGSRVPLVIFRFQP
jgi:hypothetical protein